MDYLMPVPFLLMNSSDTIPYLGDYRVPTFSKGCSPKVNVIGRPNFELTDYDIAAKYVCHNNMGSPPRILLEIIIVKLILG